jgi:predicted nucleic acid-binding protein
MSPVFVDAQFWVARFHPGDQWHEQARSAQADVEGRSLLTSEAVLVEFLNFFSSLEVLLILSQSVFKRLKRLPIRALEEIDLLVRFLEACGDVELQKICNFMFRYSPRHRMEKWPLGTIESLGDG